MTAQLQPCNACIIQIFKANYCYQFLQLAIRKDEENSSANWFKISQLEAMEMPKMAWSLITPSTIENCGKHVGPIGMFGPGLPVEHLSKSFPTICNQLLTIARFPEGDPVILKEQGGEASMEISTRDITKVKN